MFFNLTLQSTTLPNVGNTTVVQIIAGNNGDHVIAGNSLEITIAAAPGGEIMGIAPGSDPRWVQFAFQPGPFGFIKLRNTASGFSSYDLGTVNLNYKALMAGGQTIASSISYIDGTNPYLGGALNTSQGNSNTNDDQSAQQLFVASYNCTPQTLYYDGDGDGIGSNRFVITIRISDAAGRIVEQVSNQSSLTPVRIGSGLGAGIYLAEVIQGRNRVLVKLIKLQ